MRSVLAVLFAAAATLVSAETITITVANNASATNGSAVFSPQEVHAKSGDVVVFNFTQGSDHSAIRSDFASPCIPISQTNATINGFNSGPRETVNGTVFTQLQVPIDDSNVNSTMWFYDAATCAIGGVGVINANDSSTATLAGFTRNAIRLNGTGSHTTSSASHVSTASSGSSSQSASPSSGSNASSAEARAVLGGLAALPLILAALAL